jgi:cardiolipin synthase
MDDFDTPEPSPPQYDYAVRIEGPLVASVREAARRLWMRVAWAALGRRWPATALQARREGGRTPWTEPAAADGVRAALVLRDSLRHRRDIEVGYLEQIEAARAEVILANAYFFPTRRFRQALVRAARRGVAVTLLLQGKADHPLQHYASRALYRRFLAAGIHIHEYYPSLLHAKVAVFDRRVATVGSSNIDPLSLGMAREANVFVDDRTFAAELRASLHEAIENRARPVPANYWQRLSIGIKARIWLSYRLARLLMTVYRFDSLV